MAMPARITTPPAAPNTAHTCSSTAHPTGVACRDPLRSPAWSPCRPAHGWRGYGAPGAVRVFVLFDAWPVDPSGRAHSRCRWPGGHRWSVKAPASSPAHDRGTPWRSACARPAPRPTCTCRLPSGPPVPSARCQRPSATGWPVRCRSGQTCPRTSVPSAPARLRVTPAHRRRVRGPGERGAAGQRRCRTPGPGRACRNAWTCACRIRRMDPVLLWNNAPRTGLRRGADARADGCRAPARRGTRPGGSGGSRVARRSTATPPRTHQRAAPSTPSGQPSRAAPSSPRWRRRQPAACGSPPGAS